MIKTEDEKNNFKREVDPKLSKLLMRIICGVIIAFTIGMLAFTFYAQGQLTDTSSKELNNNYTYHK